MDCTLRWRVDKEYSNRHERYQSWCKDTSEGRLGLGDILMTFNYIIFLSLEVVLSPYSLWGKYLEDCMLSLSKGGLGIL